MADLPRILVLDHDSASRRLMVAALGRDGQMAVSEDEPGPGAVERLSKEPFDLVLLDPDSPSVNGWRLIGELHRAAPRTPLLILSIYFNARSVARAIEMGAEDYLSKPVDLKELRRTIHLLLDQAEADAALGGSESARHLVVRADAEGAFVEMTAPTGSPHIERFQGFVHRLLAATLNKEDYLNVRLALEESVTNAVEWGNRHDRNKTLKLSYCLLADRVTLRVEDQGEGFTPDRVPDPTTDPLAHLERRKREGKRVGGWGLFLTRKAVDEVAYNKKGNVVFLTKYLNQPTRSLAGGASDAQASEAKSP